MTRCVYTGLLGRELATEERVVVMADRGEKDGAELLMMKREGEKSGEEVGWVGKNSGVGKKS